ncbi:MAG: GNAT family N-acetyltransferase [Bdellovibrionaceae bacterium]|nr:GNAT family N-acetyltransferase [Pseudobdellovibrionaceae bacterium]MBX3032615.1 GNAT family N-acetyltransferase [Pseudobdellovibrionaceae bacterium]
MNESIIIREYKKDFAPDFERLNRDWIETYFAIEKKDLEQMRNPQALIDGGGQIFFALDGDRVVGTAAAVRIEDGVYEIAKMAVDRERRSQGIGRRLMDAAERWIIAQGARKILILTNSILQPAVRLYESSGYTEVHRGPHPSYQRADLIFAKQVF